MADVDSIPTPELNPLGNNAPVSVVAADQSLAFDLPVGRAARLQTRLDLAEGALDALVLRERSDTLIVTFHGALSREASTLPRFERLRSTQRLGVSSAYFGDPTLFVSDRLQLGWYTGNEAVDLQIIIARWCKEIAHSVDAKRIIFTGSSGGGFAALQVSALVPNSIAVPFNPQTDIFNYFANGEDPDPTFLYGETVWPGVEPRERGLRQNRIVEKDCEDWTLLIDDRVSPCRRYANPVPNWVFYVNNKNDFHYEDHYLPFLASCAVGENLFRIRSWTYEGGSGHAPPSGEQFLTAMGKAMSWSRSLPPSIA